MKDIKPPWNNISSNFPTELSESVLNTLCGGELTSTGGVQAEGSQSLS